MLIRLFSFSSSHIQHVFKMRKRKAAFCGPWFIRSMQERAW
jgi:hypothetical protein